LAQNNETWLIGTTGVPVDTICRRNSYRSSRFSFDPIEKWRRTCQDEGLMRQGNRHFYGDDDRQWFIDDVDLLDLRFRTALGES